MRVSVVVAVVTAMLVETRVFAAPPPLLVAGGFGIGLPLVRSARAGEGQQRPNVLGIDVSMWGMRDLDARIAFGGSLGFEAERYNTAFEAFRLRGRVGVARPFFELSWPLFLRSLGIDAGPLIEVVPHASFPPGVGLELSAWGMFSVMGLAVTGRTTTHERGAVYASLMFRFGLPIRGTP